MGLGWEVGRGEEIEVPLPPLKEEGRTKEATPNHYHPDAEEVGRGMGGMAEAGVVVECCGGIEGESKDVLLQPPPCPWLRLQIVFLFFSGAIAGIF